MQKMQKVLKLNKLSRFYSFSADTVGCICWIAKKSCRYSGLYREKTFGLPFEAAKYRAVRSSVAAGCPANFF